MPSLIKRLRSHRHSRGFGIHSPFAFRFVTEVLCQRHPYLAYADITSDSRVRLLLRLIVAFKPEKVAILSSQPQLLQDAVLRADSRITLGSDSPDMIVVDADDNAIDRYLPQLIGGAHALIVNADKATAQTLSRALPHGMIFDNCRGTIVVAAYSYLPRQDFDVAF